MFVMMAVLSAGIFLLLFSAQGFSQCYTETNCTGAIVPADSQRECCVETDQGHLFAINDECATCTGKYYKTLTMNVRLSCSVFKKMCNGTLRSFVRSVCEFALGAHARGLSRVYPSVPALATSASVETSKQRYSRVSLRLFLDFESWIFEKTFREKVMA